MGQKKLLISIILIIVILALLCIVLIKFMELSDWQIALLISMIGIGLSCSYIYRIKVLFSFSGQGCNNELKDKLSQAIYNGNIDGVLKDYEISNKEIQRRDNITLIIGSILITISLLILAYTSVSENSTPRSIYAGSSIGLYSIWLFVLHYTSKKLDTLSYERIKVIEEVLSKHLGYGFGIHSYISKKTSGELWLFLRRIFWGFVLLLLSFGWMLFSVSERYDTISECWDDINDNITIFFIGILIVIFLFVLAFIDILIKNKIYRDKKESLRSAIRLF